MSETGNAWYRRISQLPGGRWRVDCYENGDHADGSTQSSDVVAEPPIDDLLWSATTDDQQRSHVTVSPRGAPTSPSAWFVAIRGSESDRPRMTLVAFASDHLADGTIVSDAAFVTMPVKSESQAAAIRWWADTAVVDEIYVQAEHRRTHLGSKLIYTASGYHQHQGWPDRLHSDGRRTDLGQRFVVGLRHPDRIAAWKDRAAPMDPDA